MAIPIVPLLAVAFVASDDDRRFAELVERAYRHHGYTDEQMADFLGISRGQWADQKRCVQHLSAYRLLRLPKPVLITLYKLHLHDLGLTVLEDAALGEYLTAQLARFRKRQIKMALAEPVSMKDRA